MKHKPSVWNILIGVLWLVCIGVVVAGSALFGAPQAAAIRQAQINVLQTREQLALARNAAREETRQQMRNRLEQAKTTLDAFSCPAADESALIFQVGQLAKSLGLKQFETRFPEHTPEKTIETNRRIAEGWLTVEFVADYPNVAAFINGLERHRPALFVESIELRRSDEDARRAAVQMMLSYLIRNERPAETPQRAQAIP